MSIGIEKALDRVRKLLALSEHSGSEHEAAAAAGHAAKLMEEYQLTEALVRLDDSNAKPEAILRDARLEPDLSLVNRKRVAWKESISFAVARDLGVREYYRTNGTYVNGKWRKTRDVRGFGRESAIQTWRYTCEYLWRTVDELADKAWIAEGDDTSTMGTVRAWKNAFRIGCAGRIAARIDENRKNENDRAKAEREAVTNASSTVEQRHTLALTVVEKDQAEVNSEYKEYSKNWNGPAPSIGSVSSGDGYSAGKAAGDRVSLGGKRAGLAAGQGRLK